jgi:pimeloyl-ACP methyl ester carboxylesterase
MVRDMRANAPGGLGSYVARSRGYAIGYTDRGEGAAVVLIPGFMSSAAHCREVGYLEGLTSRHRLLIVDPLGQGESDKPHDADAYHAPDVAADVIAVMDAADLESAVLWGYSRGAWLAGMAAIEFPERLSALIIGGASLTEPPEADVPGWVDAMSRGDWATFWSMYPVPVSPELKLQFEEVNDPRAMAAERTGAISSLYSFDLSRVSVPALVYCGGDDGPEEAEPTARALKTELRVVDGCDHVGAFEQVGRVMPFALAFVESAAS